MTFQGFQLTESGQNHFEGTCFYIIFFSRVRESGVIRAETSAKYPAATCRSRQTVAVDLARNPFPSILQSGGKGFGFSD